MKTRYFMAILIGTSLVPISAHAESFFSNSSGNVGMFSEYVFRGITQSDESPALQGTLNFGQATGPYLGVWGSNVDFNDGDEAQMEVDGYGGYKWATGPVTIDAGAIYYAYPGADSNLDYDYIEGKLGVSGQAGPASLSLNVFVSPDYFAGSDTGVYTNFAASVPLADTGFTATAAVGHQTIEDDAAFGVPDYTDWSAGVSYAWEQFTFGVNYYDTDLGKSECADGCEARFVGSITRSF